jgi:predicted 3-demethylubiquinone-9 3-methyltransferase (glyoxalase superfamily)
MKKITPFLWFNGQAEEATNFYLSIFKNAKALSISRRGDGGVMATTFELNGQEFIALNGGSQFKFSEAVSFLIPCETQEEVDHLWDKLSEGGTKQSCGWLKDKFGLSWQVVPTVLGQMLQDKNRGKANSVMNAMMKMEKIDIKTLEQAYDQG